MRKAVLTVIPPVNIGALDTPCQEEVYRADDANFDLRKLLPAPTNTEEDAFLFCVQTPTHITTQHLIHKYQIITRNYAACLPFLFFLPSSTYSYASGGGAPLIRPRLFE